MRHFLAIILCILTFPAFAQETAQEEADRGFLANLISDNLSGVSREVTIIGFQGALSSQASVDVLTVADAEGVWLRMEDLVLDWNRSALFAGRLTVNELSAGRIAIFRAPVSEGEMPTPEATPFSLPELPISINIGILQADRIELGAPLLGEEIVLSLSGNVALAGGEGEATVSAERLTGQPGRFEIAGTYSNETEVLGLNMDLSEAEDGIIARLLDLPGRPAVDLTLEGTGPLDDYAADLTIATDGVDRIAGSFGLTTAGTPEAPERAVRLDVQGDVTSLIDADFGDFFGDDLRLALQGQQEADGGFSLSELLVETQSLQLEGSADIAAGGWPERLAITGAVASQDGTPVQLPVPGTPTFVDRATLDIRFDAAEDDGWQGAFVVSGLDRPGLFIPTLELAGGGIIVPATTGADGASEGGQFTADMQYAASGIEMSDAGMSDALGDEISGVIVMRRDTGAPFEISNLTLDGPGVALAAEAVIQGVDDGFQTQSTIRLDASDISRFSALAGQALGGAAELLIEADLMPLDGGFDLGVTGTTDDLAFGIAQLDPLLAGAGDIDIAAIRDETGTRLERLSITTDAVLVTADASLTSGVSNADFALDIANVGLSLPDLEGPAMLTGTASRNLLRQITLEIDATAPGIVLDLDAQAATPLDENAEIGEITATLAAQVDDLGPYATLADRAIAGGIDVTVEALGQPDASLFDVTIAGETTDLAIGEEMIDPLLAGAGTLNGRVIRTGPESFEIDGFVVNTDAVAATADGTLVDGAGEAAFDVSLNDAALVLPDLAGPVSVSGTAARSAAEVITLDVDATGPGAAATVLASIASPANGYATLADITASVDDLAPYAVLAGRDLGGAFDARIFGNALADGSRLDLTVDATTQDLQTGVAQLDPLLAGSGTVVGRIMRSGPFSGLIDGFAINTPALQASADALFVDGAGDGDFDVTINDTSLLAPALQGAASVRGTASRDASGVIDIDVDGTGPEAEASIIAQIASPEDGMEVTTQIAARLGNLAPYSALAGRSLGGSAQVALDGRFRPDGESFDIDLDAQSTNLDIGIPAVATLLRGSGTIEGNLMREGGEGLIVRDFNAAYPNITASGDLDGAGNGGTANFDVRLADIGLFTPELSGPVTATGQAQLDAASNWQITTQATGPGGTQVNVAGQVASDGNLALDVNGNAPLALANGVLEPRRLGGTLSFDLGVNGPPALDSVSGTLTVNGAQLSDPGLAQTLSGLGGTVVLNNGQGQINLGGNVDGGGRLDLTGPVTLSAPFDANLQLAIAGLVLQDPTLYRTTANGTITVNGALTGGALIAGQVDLGQTDVQVPSSGVGALGDLPDVTHRNASGEVRRTLDRAGLGVTPEPPGAGGAGVSYPLDLTINAPSRIFIRGRGLDAELGGSLRLGGTTANLQPQGQFDLVRGRLDILQQRFELSEGFVSLQGEFVPFLRLAAETTSRTGTLITIVVEGPANEPVVSFESSPELPQDEVLSQLIFGRDLSSISPLQAVQLAAAVGTLAGRGGGGIIDNVRQGLGLDDLDVTSDEDGNAAVRAGAYVSENIYTDITVGAGSTEINLNLDVTDSITARGGVDSDGDTSLGVFFERDY